MSEISKKQIAYLHLKYKIENAHGIEPMLNLGLMRAEEVTSKVLKDIYSNEDVFSAVMECSKDGVLNVYYHLRCPKCNSDELILEEDYQNIVTLREIVDFGCCCSSCKTRIHQDPETVDVRFSVPLRFLGVDEGGLAPPSLFKRVIGWFGVGKK